MTFDTLICGGFIVDGTGAPGRYADVGITDGKIAAIGNLVGADAAETIDAKGKIVAPGHVTQHTHYDAALFWDPYCSNSGENGVTTVLNANCGFGFAPVRAADKDRVMGMMETTEQIPVAHQKAAMPWDWESFPDYLERVKALPKGINVMTYLPVNPLMIYVMGVDAAKTRAPTKDELAEIHRLINEAMDAGALGISMSAMGAMGNSHVDVDGTSMPTDAADPQTLLDIAQAVVDRGEGVIQILTQIAIFGMRETTERMAELAKGTAVRVIHNVFLSSDLLPTMVDDDLAWLNGLRAKGCDVTAGAQINRGWVEAGIRELDAAGGQLPAIREIVNCNSDDDVLSLIAQPDFVTRFEEQYASTGPSNGAAGLEGQIIISVGDAVKYTNLIGKTLAELAAANGTSVVATMLDLGVKTKLGLQLKSGLIGSTDTGQIMKLLSHAGVIGGGSDGGAHTKSFGMGHYPTDLLIWLVREEGVMTLEEMHFQLSLKVARSMELYDRGALIPGFWADVLIYDLNALYFDMDRYEIVHDMPGGDWRRKGKAGGYDKIIVNGVVTHIDGAPTGAVPGHFTGLTGAANFAIAAE
ncbi:MAG: amidohydrolase family protein [Alphaproteobacteria bacterium]